MILYVVLIVTSILVGLVAVLLSRGNARRDLKAFLTGALLNAAAVLGILFYQKRRKA